MITMVTEERKPLFGKVVGQSEEVAPSPEAPHIELSALGAEIEKIWLTISSFHPEVSVIALQMMPDHLHAVLFVKEKIEKPLGKVLLGVKQACNQAFREMMPVESLLWHSNTPNRAATTASSLPKALTTRYCSETDSWSAGLTT